MTALSDAAAALDTTIGTLETEIATFITAADTERKTAGTGYDLTRKDNVTKAGREAERAKSHVTEAVLRAVERGVASSRSVTGAKAAVDLSAIYPA